MEPQSFRVLLGIIEGVWYHTPPEEVCLGALTQRETPAYTKGNPGLPKGRPKGKPRHPQRATQASPKGNPCLPQGKPKPPQETYVTIHPQRETQASPKRNPGPPKETPRPPQKGNRGLPKGKPRAPQTLNVAPKVSHSTYGQPRAPTLLETQGSDGAQRRTPGLQTRKTGLLQPLWF